MLSLFLFSIGVLGKSVRLFFILSFHDIKMLVVIPIMCPEGRMNGDKCTLFAG